MTEMHSSYIPIELMELLNKINDNVTDVKERIVRLEAQDHANALQGLKAEIAKERDERVLLQIELANVKTKLAPIVIGMSMAGAAIIEFVLKSVHFN